MDTNNNDTLDHIFDDPIVNKLIDIPNETNIIQKKCITALIITIICLLNNSKYASYILNTNPINAMAIYLQEFIKNKFIIGKDFFIKKEDVVYFENIINRLGFMKVDLKISNIYSFIIDIFSLEKITINQVDDVVKHDINYIDLNKKYELSSHSTHLDPSFNSNKLNFQIENNLHKISDYIKQLDYVINGYPNIMGINLPKVNVDLTKRIVPKTTNFLTKDKWTFNCAMCFDRIIEQYYGLIKYDGKLCTINIIEVDNEIFVKYNPLEENNDSLDKIDLIRYDLIFAWYLNCQFN